MVVYRTKGQLSDVRIRWPDDPKRLDAVIKRGRCPSANQPRKARPNAMVALVAPGGRVLLQFRLKEILQPWLAMGPNGKRYPRGCQLVAVPGSIRKPRGSDHAKLDDPGRAYGAIAYFENSTGEKVLYSQVRGTDGDAQGQPGRDGIRSLLPRVRLQPYRADNSGKLLEKAEAELVARYREWIGGSADRFWRGRLDRVSLCIDLYVSTANLLIEAKAYTARDAVRMAVGQLLDYRRFMRRRPRLAVLLPARPSRSILQYLASQRIVCIWETPTGQFGDSRDGSVTLNLRRLGALDRKTRRTAHGQSPHHEKTRHRRQPGL